MQKALDVAFKAAESEATMLLLGESGTGKSVLARAIHQRSLRRARAVRHGKLPQPFARTAGERIIRARKGGVYRGARRYLGKSGRGGWRHAFPR